MAGLSSSKVRVSLWVLVTASVGLGGCMGPVKVVSTRGLLTPPRVEEVAVVRPSGPFAFSASGFDLFAPPATPPAEITYLPAAAKEQGNRRPRLALEGAPQLESSAFVVTDPATGDVVAAKDPDRVVPIASITKLMTAMVTLDAQLPLNEPLTITEEDRDLLKGTGSRLAPGATLTRADMLRLALMSSENRAASALGRHFPGGRLAFVAAMNGKAASLGLSGTRFVDTNGLNPANVSTPRDLATMVTAASDYSLIREFSTTRGLSVGVGDQVLGYHNTNALVSSPEWNILVQKTGFINEAGRCLVMEARLLNRPLVVVLMDSNGRYSRIEDAKRVKQWLEEASQRQIVSTARMPAAG